MRRCHRLIASIKNARTIVLMWNNSLLQWSASIRVFQLQLKLIRVFTRSWGSMRSALLGLLGLLSPESFFLALVIMVYYRPPRFQMKRRGDDNGRKSEWQLNRPSRIAAHAREAVRLPWWNDGENRMFASLCFNWSERSVAYECGPVWWTAESVTA